MKKKIGILLLAVWLLLLLPCTVQASDAPADKVAPADTDMPEITLESLAHGTLGVINGSLYDGFSRALFPDAKIDSYQSFTDLFQCVRQGKIDGFLMDIPNFNAVKRTDAGLRYLTVPGYSVEMGTAFAKNEQGDLLAAQMSDFLADIRENGTADRLWDKWCGDTEPTENIVVPQLSGDSGTLRVALDLSRKPFVYLLNNEYAGFEVELIYLFCEEYGYAPTFETAQWTAGVAGLQEGKYDVLSCGIYMTDERRESVNFSDPYAVADVIMVVYENTEEAAGFFASLRDSFEKTFIREDRWKLITEGILTTLVISVCSVAGGTVFGFVLYLLTQSANRGVSTVTRAAAKGYSRLIAGTPTLVILMIFHYIIFGKTNMSGSVVAVIGFSLIFGSFVLRHLTLTVDSIDRGQTEAAYALGYSKNQTFFRIILPQALRLFLPTYTGEVVGLIKATSVVGYIAVNDLTKMGDIIRSNTYEAFFPLIAVAVIYFLITWGAAALLGLAERAMNPNHRSESAVLKGVKR